jgi:formylmethanofuran dehydrogenase subunit C
MTWHIRTRPDAIASAPVEARFLVDDLLKCNSSGDLQEITIDVGSISVSVNELLNINQTEGPSDTIYFEGDFQKYNGLCWNLKSGQIQIDGDVGSRLGADISGGTIILNGNAGSWAGVAASGGRILIHGNSGDWLGANWPGEPKGMKGGEIIIAGNTGKNAGARMRRGTIAIGGDAGSGLGQEMIAGSIFIAGRAESYIGQGMKRGSIVITEKSKPESVLSPSFQPSSGFRPLTLDMQLKYLESLNWEKSHEMKQKNCTMRFFGDTLALGLGEVILLSDQI